MSVSGVQQQASLNVFKQLQNLNQKVENQLNASMQHTSQMIQAVSNKQSGGEPGKGQHINVLA